MPKIVQRPVGAKGLVRPDEHGPRRVIGQRPERLPQSPPHRVVGPGRRLAAHLLLLIQAQPHERIRRGRQLLQRPRSLADYGDQLLSRVDARAEHAQQLLSARPGGDPEGHQRPVPVRAQQREQLVELPIGNVPRDPPRQPGPEQAGSLRAERFHRVAMGMSPACPGERAAKPRPAGFGAPPAIPTINDAILAILSVREQPPAEPRRAATPAENPGNLALGGRHRRRLGPDHRPSASPLTGSKPTLRSR